VRDSNPQPTVLETATLPIELTPYAKFSTSQLDKTEATELPPPPHEFKNLFDNDFADATRTNGAATFANREALTFFHGDGAMQFDVHETLSPGITISTPAGRIQSPVTSEVRK
jgi:hypothetical protein